MKDSQFFDQTKLMLQLLPHVAKEKSFALKGGTALNFFVRDLPRLSVDIDLTYIPIETRIPSLRNIGQALGRIKKLIRQRRPMAKIQETTLKESKTVMKLNIHEGRTGVTIEPNTVIRGMIFPLQRRVLSKQAEDYFNLSVSIDTLSDADLYGGKICAALDRQHPRDLFDIKVLFENEGMTNDIRKAFIVYLACHDRSMHELIDPTRKNIRNIYEKEFVGMAFNPVKYEELEKARELLISKIQTDLSNDERLFLVSLKEGNPNWDLLGIDGVEKLPALQWKLLNIRKMDEKKRREALNKLKAKLGL